MDKGHQMNWPPLPTRSKQLVQKKESESLTEYKRRVWEAELDRAISQMQDTSTRNAIYALRHLISF